MSRSRRYQQLREKDIPSDCEPAEAMKFVKESATANFDESVDLAITLGVDPQKSDQMVRGSVVLPHGTGKKVRIAVAAEGKEAEEAKEAGADIAGKEEVIKMIEKSQLEFDVLVASPGCMKDLARYGKMLGPRGLMPSPKSGTVSKDLAATVSKLKQGQIEYKMSKNGVLHVMIGKTSFPAENLLDNFNSFMDAVKKSRPASAKGKFIKKAAVSSTMGPSVTVRL